MKIVVLDGFVLNPGDNTWASLEKLGDLQVFDRTAATDVHQRAKDADILLVNKVPLDEKSLESLPKLKFISVLATGYNIVDVSAARSHGVVVSNVPDYGTNTVAQYTMAMLLELCHHVGDHARDVEKGAWAASPDWTFWKTPQVELFGKTMGIVGFGRIGQRVAQLAEAFGMRVIYSSRRARAQEGVAKGDRTLEGLFEEADVVSLHCGLTEENRGMVDRKLLQRMKRSSFLINTARGGLVNEADLADVLNEERIAGAALDVLSAEPPLPGNPLIGAKNCLVTPHMAWSAIEARKRIMQTTVENVRGFLSGAPQNVVS
ncbi:MAG: D-2-hydroxyacid dehydrogenase [Acidobacteria bacterium]|nr:D-2-hydroxyacid dehydrogenase [Acidobacteriota bacterium]